MAKKADLRRSKNSDLPRYVTKTPRGFYLYKRRIPKGLADELIALGTSPDALARLLPASGVWEASLGSDPAEMAMKARELTAEHDALMAPKVPPKPLTRTPEQLAERAILKAAVKQSMADRDDLWKQAGAVMDQSRAHSPDLERDALALFHAQAFGGEATATSLSIPVRIGPDGALLVGDVPASAGPPVIVPRPGGADGFMYDAMKVAVEGRQKEVAPKDSVHPLRISQLMAPMAADRGHREETANGLRRKVDRFIKFAGDKPLWEYTFEDIIDYRDHLRAGDSEHKPIKETSINQYIRALKMVWNYAPERLPVYRNTPFPNVKLRKIREDIQDSRWKAFTDDQMKVLHEVMQREWGTNAETRLTPSRRRAFLMAIRVMLYTGLRPVEVFHLTEDNIAGDNIEIRYTKTGNRRTLPISKHIADLPGFLRGGGFKAELEAAKHDIYAGAPRGKPATPASLAKSLRKYFGEIREKAGITDPKQVLYSCKDTLVRRLQLIFRQKGIAIQRDDIRDIIGHKTKGALAHYLTPIGELDEVLELFREALDAIDYW